MEMTQSTILIGGAWRVKESSRKVTNPATGEMLSLQAVADREDVEEAMSAASGALDRWQKSSAFERSRLLGRMATLLSERAQDIGRILSLETGKRIDEAIGEVHLSADYFSWFSGEARRLEKMVGVEGRSSGPQMVLQKPAGVAATLTPWNFPVSIQARKVAPALAAGCTVIARPSEEAPSSVVELFRCLMDVGVPEGVTNLLTGPAKGITDPVLEDPRVRVVSFTGSTKVGKALYEKSAPTMKHLALELGGSAPFIVCEDADLEHALEQAMVTKFRNCGQSCVAANCFYVEDGIYEDFVAGLAERISALRLGDPLDRQTTLGPLINSGRRHAVEELQERAKVEGFEHITSSAPLSENSGLSPECFLPPALFAAPSFEDIDPAFLQTEVFGPLTLVAGFSDFEGLVEHLNRDPLGLAGYVFSRNVGKAMRIAASLEVGVAGVNEGLATAVNVPMGGMKDSGLGREGGHIGMEEFLEPQYLAMRGELL